MEITKKVNSVFKGRVFEITIDDVLLSNGNTAVREKVHHNGGVSVLALMEDGTVPVVRQFRYGAGSSLLELPAGKLEKGENPESCGRRELSEECGLQAKELISLGVIYPTPAYCSEKIHLFMTLNPEKTEAHLDDDEILTVEYFLLNDLVEMCLHGGIDDAKTVAAVFRANSILQGRC